MSDLQNLLDREAHRIDEAPGALEATLQARERRQRNRRIGTAVFALALFGVVIGTLALALKHRASEPAGRPAVHGNGEIVIPRHGAYASVDPATGAVITANLLPLDGGSELGTWSPDGSSLTYREGSMWRIYDASTGDSRDLLPASAAQLRWSPDSASIAYQQDNALWTVDAATGESRQLAPCNEQTGVLQAPLCGVAWSPDGTRLALVRTAEIDLVDVDGAAKTTVVTNLLGQVLGDPSFSPDGASLVFLVRHGDSPLLFEVDLAGTNLRKLADLPGGAFDALPAWSSDGSRVAYLAAGGAPTSGAGHEQDAFIVTVDGSAPPVVVPTGSCYCLGFAPGIAWSPDGAQLALVIPGPQGVAPVAGLYSMYADGTGLRLLSKGTAGQPAWRPVADLPHTDAPPAPSAASSPAAMHNGPIEVFGPTGGVRVLGPDHPGSFAYACTGSCTFTTGADWSPDGARLAFSTACGGGCASAYDPYHGLRLVNPPDGPDRLLLAGEGISNVAWSPDGTRIAYVATANWGTTEATNQIHVVNADGSGVAGVSPSVSYEVFLSTPSWSPDGSQLAYSAGGEMSVISLDGSASISLGKGYDPAWAPDGRTIAYQLGCQVRSMTANGLDDREVVQLGSTGDECTPEDLSWSPDGTELAALSDHGPPSPTIPSQTSVFVIDPSGRATDRIVSTMDTHWAGLGLAWQPTP